VKLANSLGVDPRNGRLSIGSSVDPGQVQITDPPG
jgi:small ligand-binding sensory domain FIST